MAESEPVTTAESEPVTMAESEPDTMAESEPVHGMLKEATQDIHKKAFGMVKRFHFDDPDTNNRLAYTYLFLQFFLWYLTMERILARLSNHPLLRAIYFPEELNRTQPLERDLDFFYEGKGWRDLLEEKKTDAMKTYKERIEQVAETRPELLIAHIYTRYLGDLSGGQILKKMLKKQLNLEGENNEGLQFYSFDDIDDVKLFKDNFISRLNSLELTEQQKEEVAEEAVKAFQMNIAVYEEVRDVFKSAGSDVDQAASGGI